jgi:predicted CopG family antitoxin
MIITYNIIMTASKRIPVSEGVWEDISELKRPGQTFDDLLSHMVEQEKKRRFIEDMDRIEAEGDFVELDFDVPDTD